MANQSSPGDATMGLFTRFENLLKAKPNMTMASRAQRAMDGPPGIADMGNGKKPLVGDTPPSVKAQARAMASVTQQENLDPRDVEDSQAEMERIEADTQARRNADAADKKYYNDQKVADAGFDDTYYQQKEEEQRENVQAANAAVAHDAQTGHAQSQKDKDARKADKKAIALDKKIQAERAAIDSGSTVDQIAK